MNKHTEERTETHACDLIDRQAAIEVLESTKAKDPFDRYEKQNIGIGWAIDALKALPSAQPEHTMEEFMYGQDMGNPEDGSL